MLESFKINKNIKKNIIVSFICLVVFYILYRFEALRDIVFIIIASGVFAYILKPFYKFLCIKTKINKKLLAMLIVVVVILLVLFFFIVLIPSMFKEGKSFESLVNNIGGFINYLVYKFKYIDLEVFSVVENQIIEKLNIIVLSLANSIINGFIGFSENILAFAVIPVLAYYFLAYGDLVTNKFLYFCPMDKRELLRCLGKDVDKVLGKYILGQLSLSLVVGIMTFMGMLILELKFPLLLAVLNAILNIVPYFGAILGAIPAILVAVIEGPTKILWVILTFIIIQQIEGNLVAPKITAESIDMHPILIIVLLLIGEKVGGLIGMVFIVPIAVVIKVIYEDLDYYMFI
ncbi:AI-2E family transporter [Clostridium sp.]|uniref:AI-2E family transporter n=1 Tax=Clostridium sp. TaxID=1506 RepID=UPI00262E098B|nr:AI-2E family transporter [Clostridium sp.]